MHLSDFQQEIVQEINLGHIGSFRSFINQFELFYFLDENYIRLKLQELGAQPQVIAEFIATNAADTSRICVLQDTDVARGTDDIAEFISLIRALEENQIISVILNKGVQETKLFLWYYSLGDHRFNRMDSATQFYKEFDNHTINRLPTLKEFISNDYKTFEEIKLEKEDRNRETDRAAEKATRVKAIKQTSDALFWSRLAVIASIVIGLGTAIFNYATYKTTREVKITNQPDSIKVHLLNSVTTPDKDTSTANKSRP